MSLRSPPSGATTSARRRSPAACTHSYRCGNPRRAARPHRRPVGGALGGRRVLCPRRHQRAAAPPVGDARVAGVRRVKVHAAARPPNDRDASASRHGAPPRTPRTTAVRSPIAQIVEHPPQPLLRDVPRVVARRRLAVRVRRRRRRLAVTAHRPPAARGGASGELGHEIGKTHLACLCAARARLMRDGCVHHLVAARRERLALPALAEPTPHSRPR